MVVTKNLRRFEFGCRIILWVSAVAFEVYELGNRLNPLPRDNPVFWILLLLSAILVLATFVVGANNIIERGNYLNNNI